MAWFGSIAMRFHLPWGLNVGLNLLVQPMQRKPFRSTVRLRVAGSSARGLFVATRSVARDMIRSREPKNRPVKQVNALSITEKSENA